MSTKTSTPSAICFCTVVSIVVVAPLPRPLAADETASTVQSPLQTDDQAVARVIGLDLADTDGLARSDIEVDVQDGIVTLSGTAEHLLAKRRAAAIAKRTRGVQAVLNKILVRAGKQRPNDDIRADITQALSMSAAVDKPQIALDVNRGTVAMTGRVDSLAEKRVAETTVAGVRGVREVVNQLVVRLPRKRDDTELQQEIQFLIEHSIYLDDADIEVHVRDQVATLRGKVATAAEIDHVERLAEVMGILRVDLGQVEVDAGRSDGSRRKSRYANLSDESLLKMVRRVFDADPLVFSHADNINVQVNDGVVSLSGTVNRSRVKHAAERIALGVIGVHRVTNELKVDYPDGYPSDAEIIRETQGALKRSPYLERRDFRVHSQAAHVMLYGVVESELEKEIASRIAYGVEGVVHVANSLAVQREWVEKSDSEILADLKRKLEFAFFDKSNTVNVNVTDGVAILRGEVDTWRQWQTALDLALEAGSRHPHNLIRVRFHPPHGSPRVYVPE